ITDRLAITEQRRRGIRGHHVEYRMKRKDGSPLWVLASSVPTFDAQGQYTGVVALLADITERKHFEEQLLFLNADLAHRSAAVEAANKELEAFSYSVSHDLRAPLRAIDGFSRILQDEYSSKLDEQGARYLETVRRNSHRMATLIDDLLAFSRLGRLAIKKIKVSPVDIVRQVWEELKSEREGRQVEITIDDLALCQADPALLK